MKTPQQLVVASALKNTEPKTILALGAVAIGLVGGVFYIVNRQVKKIKDGLGKAARWLTDALQLTDSEKDQLIQEFRSDVAFKPRYWVNYMNKNTDSDSRFAYKFFGYTSNANSRISKSGGNIAGNLYKSLQWVNDYSQFLANWRLFTNKAEISLVANIIQREYNEDLFTYMNKELSNNQMIECLELLVKGKYLGANRYSKLPDYIKVKKNR